MEMKNDEGKIISISPNFSDAVLEIEGKVVEIIAWAVVERKIENSKFSIQQIIAPAIINLEDARTLAVCLQETTEFKIRYPKNR